MRTNVLRSGAQMYDVGEVSRGTSLDCQSNLAKFPTKTIQSEKDNCDINVIVKRFKVTGNMPGSMRLPEYGDYNGVEDFHTAMQIVRSATESFMSMPAGIRSRFGNDPQAFLEFCSNSSNIDELRKMGLAIPKVPDIIPVPDVPADVKENRDGSRSVKGRAPRRSQAVDGPEGDPDEIEGRS